MQSNLGELRNQYNIEVQEERIDILAGVPTKYHQPASSLLEGEEILERKKAWADLEREQQEVKRDIKSLMKLEPASRLIDDPALAERVTTNEVIKAASPAEPIARRQESSSKPDTSAKKKELQQ